MKPVDRGAVAAVWLKAVAGHQAPTKAVQEHFDVPSRTATYWVKLARDAGLLTISERPRRSAGMKLDAVARALGVDVEDLAHAVLEHANGDLRIQ